MPSTPLRHRCFALTLALALALAPLAGDAIAADDAIGKPPPPALDRGFMMFGCMSGLALGAVSLVLPPASAWVAAGVLGGGLGTMIVRGGFGCVYGGIAGAAASLARALVHWIDTEWRALKGRPEPQPLAIEGPGGS